MNDRKEMEPLEKLKKILASVNTKEKEIFINKIAQGNKAKSLEEVGRDFKVTRECIREIEKKELKRLNKKQPEPPDDAA